MKKDILFPVRFSEQDVALVDALQAEMQLASKSEVVRQAIYALAKVKKVAIKVPRKS